jgi:hypothetical protein
MKIGKLPSLFQSMHQSVESALTNARESFDHPGTKGDASEKVWLRLLQQYLPERYCAESAQVIDSNNRVSDQIDIVVFDRQYTPFMFQMAGQYYVPAEAVYAVFEAKQSISASNVEYAMDKVRSVRGLHRTSLPIPHAGGVYEPKEPIHIFGGILTLDSDWNPSLGEPLRKALATDEDGGRLDIGCIAAKGYFCRDLPSNSYLFPTPSRVATAFLFRLIALLQSSATVPMIDVDAYMEWLDK